MLHCRCVVLLTVVCASVSAAVGIRDYCPWETFNATCRQPSEVILMKSALYGRMRYGRCVRERHGGIGCASDVLRYLDGLCSGRYRCQLDLPDAHLHKAQPCPRELMSYLEASYYCVPIYGSVGENSECRRTRIPSGEGGNEIDYGYRVHGETGFLASISTQDSTVGTGECPWILRTQPGQRIVLSLISFQRGISSRKTPSPFCAQTIVVEEWNRTTEVPGCSSSEHREKRFYSSTSNELQVYVRRTEGLEATHSAEAGKFLVKFQAVSGLRDDRESDRERTPTADEENSCNDTSGGQGCQHLSACSPASCLKRVRNITIVSSAEIHNDRPCCSMPNTEGLLLIGFMVAISVALGVISLFVFLYCVSRRNSFKGLRSSSVALGYLIDGDCSRDEDSSGRTVRTKSAPELTMTECRGQGCIYQKLNNIRVVESSRTPSHMSGPPSGALLKQSPTTALELEEEAVDVEAVNRGLRCVLTVPQDVLFRDPTKI